MRIWRIQTSPRIWKRSINRRRIGSVQPARWKRRTFALLRRKKGKRILRRRTGRRKGEGDAQAALIEADVYKRDPQFYRFYKKLEIYRKSFGAHDVIIDSLEHE